MKYSVKSEADDMPKFSLDPVEEIHLHHAPLAKVLMQVQYSRTPGLVTDAAESAIADALGRYPVRRRQMVAGALPSVVVNGQPLQLPGNITPGVVLAFADPKGAWQVTVTETAVALETSTYSSRDDFCDRSHEVFEALAGVLLPPVVDRVGLRYIDRLDGDAVDRVPTFFIPELRGLAGCVDSPLGIMHSLTQTQIAIGDSESLQVRSGLVPAGMAIDPALPPQPGQSWVLDMDVFTTVAGFAFDPAELSQRLRHFAEVAYAFFRFATTDDFQNAFKGEPAALAGETS